MVKIRLVSYLPSPGLLVVGCWLLVVGCWLLVVGCWLLVVGCWLLVVGCWLLVVGILGWEIYRNSEEFLFFSRFLPFFPGILSFSVFIQSEN
jgi:hypothetical protein